VAVNSNPSLLDPGQIIKRITDSDHDAIRTVPAETTAFQIELSADDGDSVLVRGDTLALASEELDSASTGVVIAATACVGIKSFQLYGICNDTDGANLAGDIVASIEVSPSDSANVWHSSGSTVTLGSGQDTGDIVVANILSTLIARRIRVSLTSNALTGDDAVTFYLVGNSV
jgi:hypothetical protein